MHIERDQFYIIETHGDNFEVHLQRFVGDKIEDLPVLVNTTEQYAIAYIRIELAKQEVAFPKHVSLSIEHNEHNMSYCSVENYISNLELIEDDFTSKESMDTAIQTNELWSAVWFPDTPVGSHVVYSHCLTDLMKCLRSVKP